MLANELQSEIFPFSLKMGGKFPHPDKGRSSRVKAGETHSPLRGARPGIVEPQQSQRCGLLGRAALVAPVRGVAAATLLALARLHG